MGRRSWVVGLAVVVAGCVTTFAEPAPSIEFGGATYNSVWPSNLHIEPGDLTGAGSATRVDSGDVAGTAVLALEGVDARNAVVMLTRPGTELPYLLFVRPDALKGADGQSRLGNVPNICPYVIDAALDGC